MTYRVRTLDFLPEIFRTKANEEFLTATLDTLVQTPKIQKLQGFIGSKFGYGVNSKDVYLSEPSTKRSNYQLDPAVIFKKKDTNIPLDVMTYTELNDALRLAGSNTQESKLYSNEFYSWDSFCDLDKLVNYSQYYWLPGGPDAVTVTNVTLSKTMQYSVSYSPLAFSVSSKNQLIGDHNPELTLVRGGTYYFNVDQESPFYIQMTTSGTGYFESRPNVSTREIYGLQNNGISYGTIKFEVPLADAQTDWELARGPSLDLVTTLNFNDIHSKAVGSVSIDGISDLEGKTLLFYKHNPRDTGNILQLYDTLTEEYDTTPFEESTITKLTSQAYTVVYVGEGDNKFIELVESSPLPINQLMNINYGTEFNGRDFVKNEYGEILLAPFATAQCDTYYYQDGKNPELYGVIRIVDKPDSSFINVKNILGKKTYTSENGITFTNGLKVEFSGNIYPEEYSLGQYYVEGVGDSINLIPESEMFVAEKFAFAESADFDVQPYDINPYNETTFVPIEKDYITISRNATNRNAWSRGNRWFHTDVLKTTLDHNAGAKVVAKALGNPDMMAKRPIIEFYPNLKLMNSGENSKDSITYINFTETNALLNVAGSDSFLPDGNDSILFNGARVLFAKDSNPNVRNKIYSLSYSETFKSTEVLISGLSSVTVNADGSADVTFDITPQDVIIPKNKLLSIIGNLNSSYQGVYKVIDSSQIHVTLRYNVAPTGTWNIPLNWTDETPPTPANTYLITNLELTLTPVDEISYMDQITVNAGTKAGKVYYYTGTEWLLAQEKTYVNQSPLFDIVDKNGHSFSDMDFYPSSTFSGSTLFQYSVGSGVNDTELRMPIKYNFIQNVGDIEFTVTLNSETFTYNLNGKQINENVRTGYVVNNGEYKLGWETAIEESFQYQVFNMVYTGTPFEPTFICDVPVKSSSETAWTPCVVYVDNVRQASSEYKVTTSGQTTTIVLNTYPAVGTKVDIMLLSDSTSQIGYYQIPLNLDHNPYNEQISSLTLGDIRGHYKTMFNNAPGLTGTAFGANNFRDLGNLVSYGTRIIQNSAPLTLPAAFLRNNNYNFFDSVIFNSNEYSKYKTLLISTLNNNDFSYIDTASGLLDEIIEIIAEPKTETNPFFWSDMLPARNKTVSKTYTFKTKLDNSKFDLSKIYDFNSANYSSVLVYLTRKEATGVTTTTQLTNTIDYVISSDEAVLTITKDLIPGDKIQINEYHQTYGSFVPNTPTKLGLYPAYIPEVVLDTTYVTPTWFIKGHDGSYQRLYGEYENGILTDARDSVIFEFEQRVFNNLKVLNKTTPIKYEDIAPGYFRTSKAETEMFASVYETQFMNWVGQNRIDFETQTYDQLNDWTWNYKGSKLKLNNDIVNTGCWRGVYLWLYDTTTPHVTPWEMLGLTIKPAWWDSHYGEAPYTSDNTIMWQDIANGYVWNEGNSYINKKAIRPGLMDIIPVDTYGRLISPFGTSITSYDIGSFKNQWILGDVGPAEFAYRKSSTWAFDLIRLAALQIPAKFFNLNLDLDYYQYSKSFNQYLTNDRYRISPPNIKIYGTDDTTAAHSYINWIVDYVNQSGSVGSDDIKSLFNNTSVSLTYNVAGFTNKDMIKFFTENSSTSSSRASLIPEDSYHVLLHRNQAVDTIVYSSLIIQRTLAGYKVYGNRQTKAFFTVLQPISGLYDSISVNGKNHQIARRFSNVTKTYPYGYEFKTIESLLEFVKGYGLHLEKQGMVFDDVENSITLSWDQMMSEILYWIQTGWNVGSTVNVNPAANVLTLNTTNSIIEPLTLSKQNFVLNQDLLPIPLTDLSVYRNGTELTIKALNTGDAISFFNANVGSIEHVVVFDNKTIFGDTISNLVTGLRQQRFYVKGTKTAEWNGYINNAGFIMSLDSITDWTPNSKYVKGQVVKYKNEYWMSNQVIIKPTNTFNQADWIKTSYEMIQQRMLPNQSTRSLESTMFYDMNNANLASDADLLSYSLIGYRPRDYLAGADLNDGSQVRLHADTIPTKGTTASLMGMHGANIKDETLEYSLHENWAIKNLEFGGINNHNYVQFGLDESKLTGNPSIVSLINYVRVDNVNQEVNFADVTNYGRTLANEFVLPQLSKNKDDVMRSAGYVHLDDVIELGYSIDEFNDAAIGAIYKNDYVWVANKDNKWDVFTPSPISSPVIAAVNNLNGTVTLEFENPHNVLLNQVIGLINLDARFDGYHVVTSVPSIKTLVVSKTVDSTVSGVTGTGLAFLLQSHRVATPRDIPYLPLNNNEYDSTKVWVDAASDGDWKVYKKSLNYTHNQIDGGYGSVTMGDAVAYVPGIGYFVADKSSSTVMIYSSLKDDGNYYLKNTLSYPGTNFGSVIAHADKTIVITAPQEYLSQIFIYRDATEDGFSQPVLEQTIVLGGSDPREIFGATAEISGDGNHLFIAGKMMLPDDPVLYEVIFMYSLDASLFKTGLGITLASDIVVNRNFFTVTGDATQTVKDGQRVSFATSYSSLAELAEDFDPATSDASDSGIASPDGLRYREFFKLAGDVAGLLSNGDSVSFGNTGADRNKIYTIVTSSYVSDEDKTLFYIEQQPTLMTEQVNGSWAGIPMTPMGTMVYKVTFDADMVYTIATKSYNSASDTTTFYVQNKFNHSVPSGSQIYVATMNYELVEVFSGSMLVGWVEGDEFGASITTNYDGSKLFIGAPKHNQSASQIATGNIYALDRMTESFEVQKDVRAIDIHVVMLPWYPGISALVYVNGQRLKTNQYIILLNAVIFKREFYAGDIITVKDTKVVQTGTFINGYPGDLRSGQWFGHAMDCSSDGTELVVSAPYALTSDGYEGAVYRFTDPGKRYGMLVGSTAAALNEPTYLLLNGYRVNAFNVFALGSTVTTNSTSVTLTTENAKLLPASGVIRFRKSTNDTYDIAYSSVDTTTGIVTFSVAFPYTVTCTSADTQIYAPLGSATNIANKINASNITNIFAYSTEDGRLVIRLRDMSLAPNMNKLNLSVFNGNFWTMLGIMPYPMTQTIVSPHKEHQTQFGYSLKFNERNSFVVGAPTSTRFMSTRFDYTNDDNVHNDTVFDNNMTTWEDGLSNAGAVYMYDYIDSYEEALDNVGKYIYSQPCNDLVTTYGSHPLYGTSLDFNNNRVVIGAPGMESTGGKVVIYRNDSGVANWAVHRESDQVVDIERIQKIQLFNNKSDTTEVSLDYFDPLQGKLLSAVASNLDFTTSVDPASYNANTKGSIAWGADHVGKIWFDTSNVRFIHYHQNDVAYNSKYWGRVFPGSDVAVYTWVESSVPPASYVGSGTVYNTSLFSVDLKTDSTDNLVPTYYFWVKNSNILSTSLGKTLVDSAITNYINYPQDSGVPYVTPLRTNVFGLHNSSEFIQGKDTSIHVGFSTTDKDVRGHSEFKLIRTNYESDFLPGLPDTKNGIAEPYGLYAKYIDSFAGEDAAGATVPDASLPKLMQTGVNVRPRQSMFVDRLLALKNFIQYTNNVLINYPVAEFSSATFLHIASDTVDTTKYWDYAYWWAEGYSSKTRSAFEVEGLEDLKTVPHKENLIVSVTKNAMGNREVYISQSSEWIRIGLENGTYQFLTSVYDYSEEGIGYGTSFYDVELYDSSTAQETRYIVRAINEQLFVGSLSSHKNKSLTLMFEYIQSENIESHNYLPWLNKTKLADVHFTSNTLAQKSRYVADESNILQGYINEVKPYSVVIKDFIETHNVLDTVNGSITDFDLPSYYDFEVGRFISPQVVFGASMNADQKDINDAVWNDYRYYDWINNLGMTVHGGDARFVSTLTKYIDKTSLDVYVENAYTLPYQGIVFLGDEQIGYTSIDRVFGKLKGVTRGANNTTLQYHNAGTPIYMNVPDVVVLTTGKNYQLPPKVTAYIDTTIYPEPRVEALFEAVMQADKVVGIKVLQNGEGYVVAPEIIIEPSVTHLFDNFDNGLQNATTLIDLQNNCLFTSKDISVDVSSYDVVKLESVCTGLPVINNGFYYVKVTQTSNGAILRFFETYNDAKLNTKGIQFNTNVITTGYQLNLHVTAHAIPTMQTIGARDMKTTLKFDRVSYHSKVVAWEPGKFWSSPYYSLGNDASSSEDSSSTTILSSSQGAILPVTGVRNDNGFVVVELDYSYSNVEPGQIDSAELQFYKVTPSYIPSIVDGTGGKARIEIFRPKFQNNRLSEVYTMRVLEPGSIYENGYTIRIKGSELGGVDGTNDATILVKVTTETTGEILVASISGKASGAFGKFYVKPINDIESIVYSDPAMTTRVQYSSFIWNGALNSIQDFGSVGTDYAYLPEPVIRNVFAKHDEVSIVSYAGVIWACKESNHDNTFDPAKWIPMTTADVSMTALERIDGFYQPTPGMIPKDYQQLLKGITYPNTVYFGNKFAPEDIVDLDVVLTDNEFTNTEANIKAGIFDGQRYLAVAEYADSVFVLMQNESGTWSSTKLHQGSLNVTSFTYTNEIYVITADSETNPMFVSFDAHKWLGLGDKTAYDQLDFDDGTYDDSTLQIKEGGILNSKVINGEFYSVGYKIDTSSGGLSWKVLREVGNSKRIFNEVRDITYVENSSFVGYVAIGKQSIIISGEGTPAPVSEDVSLILVSIDGESWSEIEPVTSQYLPIAIVVNGDMIVVTCESGKIIYSHNATSWVESQINGDPVTDDIIDVVFGNGLYVAITAGSLVLTSTDGVEWNQLSSVTTNELNDISFTNGNFVMSGAYGTLMISSNTINWENILKVTATDTSYIVKGNDFLFGYGPEELVAGVVTDRINLTVTTAPGAYWNRGAYFDNGEQRGTFDPEELWHYASGFGMVHHKAVVDNNLSVMFDEVVANGAGASVFIVDNDGTMTRLYENRTTQTTSYSYYIDWCNKIVTFNDEDMIGQTVLLELYEFGNAVERQRSNTENMPLFDDPETGHSSIHTGLPISLEDIAPTVFAQKQGQVLTKLIQGTDFIVTEQDSKLVIAFFDTYDSNTDYIVYSITRTGRSDERISEHYISLPETQFFTEGGSQFIVTLDTTNLPIPNVRNTVDNLIVELDGSRLRNLYDYMYDEGTNTLITTELVNPGQTLAVTMFRGMTRQYMSTVQEVADTNVSEYTITVPSPVEPVLPAMMSPIEYSNGERAWVTVDGLRIDPSLVVFGNNNLMTIKYPVQSGQVVLVTAMISSASPNEQTFRLEIDKNNNKVVRRMNQEDSTWLVNEINEVNTEIHVFNAEHLVEEFHSHSTVEQLSDGTLYAFINSFYPDLVNITVFNLSTGVEVQVPSSSYRQTRIQGVPAVVFDADVASGDELKLVLLHGDIVEINGEKIRFDSIDLENNVLRGITRGALGTQIVNYHPEHSRVYSLSQSKVLDSKYYDINWTDKTIYQDHSHEVPLQLSQSEPAKFLRMNNI